MSTAPTTHAHATSLNTLTKVSYFVSADATEANPQAVLSGDCNIGNIGTTNGAPAVVRFGTPGSSGINAGPEVTSLGFSTATGNWAWTANDLHQGKGNLLITDGSVQSTAIQDLHAYMQGSTNNIQGPCWNFLP